MPTVEQRSAPPPRVSFSFIYLVVHEKLDDLVEVEASARRSVGIKTAERNRQK